VKKESATPQNGALFYVEHITLRRLLIVPRGTLGLPIRFLKAIFPTSGRQKQGIDADHSQKMRTKRQQYSTFTTSVLGVDVLDTIWQIRADSINFPGSPTLISHYRLFLMPA
jgi:hypothetical protein